MPVLMELEDVADKNCV